nr:hypothetical protein [Tanacetum cinerariifolium]
MLVRQTYSPTTLDTKSKPFEDPSETEEPQPLSLTSTPPSPDYTPATPHTDDELESFETSEIRYRGTFKLIADTETGSTELKDDGTDSEDEESAPESQQQQAISAEGTAEDEPLGLGYRASIYHALELPIHTTWEDPQNGTIYRYIECYIPPVRSPVRVSPTLVQTPSSPVGTPASPEWFTESSPISPVIPSSIASPAPAATLGKSVLLEIGAQLDLHRSILHTQTVAVRKEIHSHRFRLRSLERGHEETRITIGTLRRLILALEPWAGYTDTQRGSLWHAIYEDQREICD